MSALSKLHALTSGRLITTRVETGDVDAGETVEIDGVTVEVVSLDQAKTASLVVCGSISYYIDDVHAKCSDCRAAIVHRPYAPPAPKVCIECATLRARAQ